jgi:DNA-binding response OmpR family regulator
MSTPQENDLPTRPPGDPAESSLGKLIMIVEDDPGLRSLYRLLLQTRGHRVIAAADGEAALRTFAAEGRDIDLLIADICLPRLGGVEMLTRLKASGLPLPRVLICSGAVEYDTELQLRAIGATHFLPKPFRNGQMLDEVDRMLGEAA